MLQAMLKNGSLVTLAHYSREEIKRLRKRKKFFCPSCRSELIVKAGQKVIPHFAHKGDKLCPSVFGEGPEHEQGKLLLYQWLIKQKYTVHLEKYLPTLKQTPDLLLSLDHRSLAIEYQRANLSRKEFLNRTQGYLHNHLVPLWILGENKFSRRSTYSLRMTPLLRNFLHKFSSTCKSILYFFCPHTKQFSLFQDLYFPENNRALGQFTFLSLDTSSFRHFFRYKNLSQTKLFQLWLQEKIRFRTRYWTRAFGRQKSWLEWLYARGLHWQNLPSIAYLPVEHEMLMVSEPWDWQSRLVVDLLKQLQIGDSFSLGACFRLLKDHIVDEKAYPLYRRSGHPILEYLQLLEQTGVIRRKNSNHFIKLQSIEFNKNIEDAIMNDKLLINTLISNKKSNLYKKGDF